MNWKLFFQEINFKLQDYGTSLNEKSVLKRSILKLSDYYLENDLGKSPWAKDWAKIAGLSYYMPLSIGRYLSVLNEAKRHGFFNGISQYVDFGSGLGPLSWALSEDPDLKFEKGFCIEESEEARRIHQSFPIYKNLEWGRHPPQNLSKSVVFFSFSLTEIQKIPEWALHAEALVLIEPATKADGIKTQILRNELIKLGFYVWAPCTHQNNCPLLNAVNPDWCHFKVAWKPPQEFLDIEKHLPIKNPKLQFSYFLLRKTPPPTRPQVVRIIGDEIKEKGKIKYPACRGDLREFLVFLKRFKLRPKLKRGDFIELAPEVQTVSNEIRPETMAHMQNIHSML